MAQAENLQLHLDAAVLERPSRLHVPALDGLRGVAVLMVVGIHFLYTKVFPVAPPAYLSVFHVLQFGWMGVDLFFALSGFLITGILLDSKDASNYFRSFYARRSLRIFPLYYLVVLFVFLVLPHLPKSPLSAVPRPDPSSFVYFLTYTSNWWSAVTSQMVPLLGPFWSLAVEEQFYLVWPVLVYAFSRRHFVTVCLVLCVVAFVFRTVYVIRLPDSLMPFEATLAKMDTLAWGALAALLVRAPVAWARLRPYLPWVAGACLAGVLAIDFPLHEFYSRSFYTRTIGYTLMAIGFSALILMVYASDLERGGLSRGFRGALLVMFGRYSYGIYVYHSILLVIFEGALGGKAWFGHSLWRALLLYVGFNAACLGVAAISFHVYERPFLELKRRFAVRQARALPATAAERAG